MGIQKLTDWLKTTESQTDFKEYFDNLSKLKISRLNKMEKILGNLSTTELEKWLDNFFKWEDAYEEMYYKKGIDTHSNIFTGLTEYSRKHGKLVKFEYEDFLSSIYEWKGYKFKLYQGQGSFWRIEKDNEIIFQT